MKIIIRNYERGFTYIELLVAVLLSSTVLLGLSKSYLLIADFNTKNQRSQTLATLVSEFYARAGKNPTINYFNAALNTLASEAQSPGIQFAGNCEKATCSPEIRFQADVAWFAQQLRNIDVFNYHYEPCQQLRCMTFRSSMGQESLQFPVAIQ